MTKGGRRRSLRLSWSLLGEMLNVAAGVVVFVLAALVLPVTSLGQYAGLVGVATIVTPVALMGRPQVLQMSFARGEPIGAAWSEGLQAIGVAAVATAAVATPIGALLVPEVGVWVVLLVIAGSITGQSVVELAVTVHQAGGRMQSIAFLRVFVAACRVGPALVVWAGGRESLSAFAAATAAGWLGGTACAVASVSRLGDRVGSFHMLSRQSFVAGRSYVPSAASFALLDAVDRPLLVAFGFDAEAGAYAAAFRFVALTTLPLMALVRLTDADFYRLGAASVSQAKRLADSLTKSISLLHVVLGGGLLLAAPLLPLVLGDDFQDSVVMVRALCLLPILRGAQIFYANALTGSGYQRDRNVSLLVAMILNLCLNLVLIPSYGWIGAVIATLLAESVRTAIVWHRCRSHSVAGAAVEA